MAFQVGAFQTNYQQVISITPAVSGGGRIIGHYPDYKKPKKVVLDVKWTDEHDKELAALLRKIDEDYEKHRREQFDDLMKMLREAIHVSQEIALSGFHYLREQDFIEAKRRIQQEEEAIILLMLS